MSPETSPACRYLQSYRERLLLIAKSQGGPLKMETLFTTFKAETVAMDGVVSCEHD